MPSAIKVIYNIYLIYSIVIRMSEKTTILISKELWKRLHNRKQCGDSFEDVINKLLEEVK